MRKSSIKAARLPTALQRLIPPKSVFQTASHSQRPSEKSRPTKQGSLRAETSAHPAARSPDGKQPPNAATSDARTGSGRGRIMVCLPVAVLGCRKRQESFPHHTGRRRIAAGGMDAAENAPAVRAADFIVRRSRRIQPILVRGRHPCIPQTMGPHTGKSIFFPPAALCPPRFGQRPPATLPPQQNRRNAATRRTFRPVAAQRRLHRNADPRLGRRKRLPHDALRRGLHRNRSLLPPALPAAGPAQPPRRR